MRNFKLYDYNQLMDFTDIEMTAKEAICAKCHECCCFQATEVKKCKQTDCALFKFKEKWYKIPMKISDEVRNKRKENMIKNRQI